MFEGTFSGDLYFSLTAVYGDGDEQTALYTSREERDRVEKILQRNPKVKIIKRMFVEIFEVKAESEKFEFIKEILKDLEKREIFNLESEDFLRWCSVNDFIPANIKEEIQAFKCTEEGQRWIIGLRGGVKV